MCLASIWAAAMFACLDVAVYIADLAIRIVVQRPGGTNAAASQEVVGQHFAKQCQLGDAQGPA